MLEINPSELEKYIEDGTKARRSISIKDVTNVSKILFDRLKEGGKLISFCNGDSAADAQHFAAELSERFLRERRAYTAIALSTNTSSLTAIENDYDYSRVFSRQIEGICIRNDYVVGIRTSGNSQNVINGVRKAKEIGSYTLALTGMDGGKLRDDVDHCIRVKSNITLVIQEVHITIIHMICYSFDGMLE